ncbi:MAG TPA: DUF4399 domain-containing protein [Acidimicrobiales bacterium]|nr:DUF4399 domain-containing protein [Acidimicrobiales bacterium]
MRRIVKTLAAVLAMTLITSACGSDDDDSAAKQETPDPAKPALAISTPRANEEVAGNVVDLNLTVSGVEIVKADNDTSGKSGHFHVFIDREPVAVGQSVPKEAGVVHSADNPVRISGLSIGTHKLTVVLGDGAHTRITDVVDSVTVKVTGPTVDATAPATSAAGASAQVTLKVEGVTLVAAASDIPPSKTTGHLHAFIDIDPSSVAPGTAIPKEEGKIIHFAETTFTTPALAAGEHTIWFVLGDGGHVAYDPPVMDKVTITVA